MRFCKDCPAAERDEAGNLTWWGPDHEDIHCRLLPLMQVKHGKTGYCYMGRREMERLESIERARTTFTIQHTEEGGE